MMRAPAIAALILTTGCGAGLSQQGMPGPAPRVTPEVAAAWQELIASEDARIATAEQLETLRDALGSGSTLLRATAVRGLGRSERPELASMIIPLLRDPSDSVRAAAAHALGDVSRRSGAAAAREALLEALPEPGAGSTSAGAMAETLGRLAADADAARSVAARLTPFLAFDDVARLGVLRGFYFLARQSAAREAVASTAADALREVALDHPSAGRASSDPGSALRNTRERSLAVATLALVRAADAATLRAALDDPSPFVRREAVAAAGTLAVAAAGTLADAAAFRLIIERAESDRSSVVRYEALRMRAARLAETRGCEPVLAAVRDSSLHVSILAIDLLGSVCRAEAPATLLDSLAAVSAQTDSWHRAAHAVVALAAVNPVRAGVRGRDLAMHRSAFARTYAARAAAAAADTALLQQLARDPHPNVRTAATAGLAAVIGHAADTVYIAQLSSDESELLMAAAAALEGSTLPEAADRLLDALDRVSALRRETSRDGRVALLERIRELGSAALADRVRPYLTDFDPVIAERAAAVIDAWTGTRPAAAPVPLERLPVPTFAEAAGLAATAFVLEIEDGGEIEIRLLPFDAPTNAARFARLARTGYFDGLTVHRVVPNFVVQGGSPGANEYSGDGPFTRDELGVPNWRGTVGLSTRGRDTGDAQFFINLIDNVRLDHEYTVFGVVTRGMDIVDRLREGVVIRRVREQSAHSSAQPR
ncbi:MAG TPA: peptidylprolyl isomerase [Longimicrobiales bacterium]|nr:peptidylprolyl isomerase [Longimicrobiales bacterium]